MKQQDSLINKLQEEDNLIKWQEYFQDIGLDYFKLVKEVGREYSSTLTNTFIQKPFSYFPPGKIKVVIIGQDPYPKEGDATGLALMLKEA